jgi:acetyl esterase/lipase
VPVRNPILLSLLALISSVACGGSSHPLASADAASSDAVGASDTGEHPDSSVDAGAPDSGPATPAIAFASRGTPSDPWMDTTRAFFGDMIDVKLSGLPAGQLITLRAVSKSWTSSASFRAAQDGTVDLASAAPESGTYSGVDVDGMFWSMSSKDPSTLESFKIVFDALSNGSTIAQATLDRYGPPDGAAITPVHDQGLFGVFVAPTSAGPHPALITFGGSEGGISTGQFYAEYYASLGYACLGLAYFGEPGLPSKLVDVPLEYFQTALHWLEQRPEVDPMHIGVMGGSRGGELALLLGSTYPEIKAVVAYVPSGVVWGGTSTAVPERAAWTKMGRELPFIPYSGAPPQTKIDAHGNTEYIDAPVFIADLNAASAAAKSAATIHVEQTAGPILILAGADDELWSSCTLAQVAEDRLTMMGHATQYADHFECFADAGHLIGTPGLPTTNSSEYFFQDIGAWFALGGTPQGNAHASRQSDTEIRAFLHKSLGGP